MNDKRFTFQPSLQQNAESPTPLETYMQNNTNMSSQMLNQPATAQINMSSLIDAGYQPPKSIGLPIHNLIEPSTMAPKDGPVATVEPQFKTISLSRSLLFSLFLLTLIGVCFLSLLL